jgi:PPP family 3-phenylpropionic acid transporter
VPLAFFFGSGSYTLCETKMLEDLAQAGQGHAFGRARKWGSFGFLAAASLGGAVFSLGGLSSGGSAFAGLLGLCALAYFGCCVALALVNRAGPDAAASADSASASGTLGADAARSPRQGDTAARPVLAAASLVPQSTPGRKFMGAGAITGMRLGEAISTTWFGAYWLHTGHSPLQTGLLCALPVAAEFLAMWKGSAFLQRYSAAAMMLLCTALSAVRWLATPLCDQLWCAVPLQAVHAFTFGFFYPASLLWLKHEFADGFFQARYATESVARALTALVSYLAAGWVIAAYGYGAVYATSSALAVLCCLWWVRVVRG